MNYFTKETFAFLSALKRNNNKEWFHLNKDKFEEYVRNPFLKFIVDYEPYLNKIAPQHEAIAKKSGGSLFRINKDIRFGNRDEPYKTWISAQFRHNKGKDYTSPGFYLHIEPNQCFFGAGIWHPDTLTCGKIRKSIFDNQDDWLKIKNKKSFKENFEMKGNSLKKLPKEFLDCSKVENDLILKDFVIDHLLTKEEIMSPDLLKKIIKLTELSSDFVSFLTNSVGLKFK